MLITITRFSNCELANCPGNTRICTCNCEEISRKVSRKKEFATDRKKQRIKNEKTMIRYNSVSNFENLTSCYCLTHLRRIQ